MSGAPATHVIVHRYAVDPAGDNRRELWPVYVPKLKSMSGFLGVYTFDDPDRGEGISLTFWADAAAAQGYIDSTDRADLDREASAFRPNTDRRIMEIINWDDTRIESGDNVGEGGQQ